MTRSCEKRGAKGQHGVTRHRRVLSWNRARQRHHAPHIDGRLFIARESVSSYSSAWCCTDGQRQPHFSVTVAQLGSRKSNQVCTDTIADVSTSYEACQLWQAGDDPESRLVIQAGCATIPVLTRFATSARNLYLNMKSGQRCKTDADSSRPRCP